ncbi:MAG: hypothetical protein MUF87_14275 [Anaerolineae bacterium]|jgi:hypothetical protein|nr:hypothetical protein [Anaerolineae bacterium]
MQPGLTRAVPMAFIGFVLGAALVLLLRSLQSMDPVWDAQLGMISAVINSSIFFVWGMGAFDPKMSEHHAHAHYDDEKGLIVVEGAHEEAHHDEDHAPIPQMLTGQIWQITFWSIVLTAGLLLFASLDIGPSLTISNDPMANRNQIGYYTMNLFGTDVVVSELTAFAVFFAFTLLSLGAISAAVGVGFYVLSRNVTQAKTSQPVPLGSPALGTGSTAGLLTAGETPAQEIPRSRRLLNNVRDAVIFLVIFVVLYVLFYEVLIGLVLREPFVLRILLSLANALIITILIRYPTWLLITIGRLARGAAKTLRQLPEFLGQK